MRQVTYFRGGTVADFVIPDERFEEFSRHIRWEIRHAREQLERARRLLESFVARGQGEAGPGETAAACFVWNYFNTHPDNKLHISGDIAILDMDGDGQTIEYVPAADIQIAREAEADTPSHEG